MTSSEEYNRWFASELRKLQERVGYFFSDPFLLEKALTHSSYAYEHGISLSNERLEFLGDAALQLCVSHSLFSEFPQWDEGMLSQRRASLVCGSALLAWGQAMGVCVLLKKGKGMSRNDESGSTCADAAEALIGAIFLDGGYEGVFRTISAYLSFQNFRSVFSEEEDDPKSRLQRASQEHGLGLPTYETVTVEGPSHAPLFTVRIL
ncbi:MAG: ribonuclease III, partial [Synergistaceae bacterium]|nr:ribonuclease III [Synergistaceae bacterium]